MMSRTSNRQKIQLGAELGKGGEGIIYKVSSQPNLVAKMWTEPDEAKARKLDALFKSKPNVPSRLANKVQLAWPSTPLLGRGGQVVGFYMPRAPRDQYREFIRYSSPVARSALEKEYSASIGKRELLSIARNVAETFDLVHKHSCLIGDVNHTNFLVGSDTSVFLIDIDSMQVKDGESGEVYRCEVGTPDFTPPRLMGKRMSEIDREPNDDYFGLAVLIFLLLMEGNHPYDPVDSSGPGSSGNARLENIKRNHSPYTAILTKHANAWMTASKIPDPALRSEMREDILALIEEDSTINYTAIIGRRLIAWLGLDPKLQDLFRGAFSNESLNAALSRPTPREWIDALQEAIDREPAPAVASNQASPSGGLTSASLRHTSRQATVPLTNAIELWKFQTDDAVTSSPAVVNGVVYVGSNDGNVYAIDATKGDQKWKYKTGGKVESSPAVVNGVVYVGSNDGNVYAIDATKGTKIWSYPTGGIVHSSPIVVNDRVYVGSSDRSIYTLDASSRKLPPSRRLKRTERTGGAVRSSPVAEGEVVYVGSNDNHIYALDAATRSRRRLIWRQPTGGRVESIPTVANGVVYAGSLDKHVYALDVTARNWHRVIWKYATRGSVRSSPTVENGVVYVGSLDKHMYALNVNATTNRDRLKWRSDPVGGVWTSPVVADGIVYFGSNDGHVYALDAVTGDQKWVHKTGDAVRSSPALVDGVLYVGSGDGYVHALQVARPAGSAPPSGAAGRTPAQARSTKQPARTSFPTPTQPTAAPTHQSQLPKSVSQPSASSEEDPPIWVWIIVCPILLAVFAGIVFVVSRPLVWIFDLSAIVSYLISIVVIVVATVTLAAVLIQDD